MLRDGNDRMELAAISLFSGAGGLDIGLEAAGIETRVAVEADTFACATLRHNRPSWRVFEQPIEELSTRSLLRAAGRRKRELDLVVGGPPCQPFSKSGYWANGETEQLRDPRAGTLKAFMRVVEESLPKAFLLENVPGFAYDETNGGLQYVRRVCQRINRETRSNYLVTACLVNAADYGVPQLRERLIVVGMRDGSAFKFPEPRFGREQGQPYRTAWDAIGDLPDQGPSDETLALTGKWADLVPSIPEGENYLFHTNRKGGVPLFGWRTRYWSFLLKLSKRLPSWTIQAQPGSAVGPFHWKNRKLSCRELLRLQTFPDDFEVLGSRVEVQRQIGNAVPCLLGEVLGRRLKESLLGKAPSRKRLIYLPPDMGPVPRAERRRPVPAKYRQGVGSLAAHPGTGQGPGAIARKSLQV